VEIVYISVTLSVPDQTKLISAFQHHRHSDGFSSTVKYSLNLKVNGKKYLLKFGSQVDREHSLRAVEKWVLRKIFELNGDEVTGEWSRLHHVELRN